MTTLPITQMTLYKHGVGYYVRRASLDGESVKLSFRVEDMNDILKSLTAIDWGGGQVLGVDYTTPQSKEERLAGCSIRLSDDRSLRDLLVGLRGRQVRLETGSGGNETSYQGILLGLDEPPEKQPIDTALVSVLLDESQEVAATDLEAVRTVVVLDEQGANDLRFFLETSLGQEDYRSVTIRLSPGEHDLSVSYIAPAPTWRVSYRMVLDTSEEEAAALLQGWGIFDNRLEEDLDKVTLSLTAGMPISFIYDLYTPFTPERPVVQEESRVAVAPVEFERAAKTGARRREAGEMADASMMAASAMPAAPAAARASFQQTTQVDTGSTDLGELFQYNIRTPVSVGRGQSAMVPIVSSELPYRKQLIYNNSKLAKHPVATIRMSNDTGLSLERGPVTVMDENTYLGEAILPFTTDGAEINVPYAVELGVSIREDHQGRRERFQISLAGAYLLIEEWDIWERTYRADNSTGEAVDILIEHPRNANYKLFDTPDPAETTGEMWRFAVEAAPREETTFVVRQRYLVRRQEELIKQSYENLKQYLRQGLINQDAYEKVVSILRLREKLDGTKLRLAQVEQSRQRVYKAQEQIQGNMKALDREGKEGQMRESYLEKLSATETELASLASQEAQLEQERTQIEKQIEQQLEELK